MGAMETTSWRTEASRAKPRTGSNASRSPARTMSLSPDAIGGSFSEGGINLEETKKPGHLEKLGDLRAQVDEGDPPACLGHFLKRNNERANAEAGDEGDAAEVHHDGAFASVDELDGFF